MLRKLYDRFMHTGSSGKEEKKEEVKQEKIKPNYFEKLPDEILKYNLFQLIESKNTARAFAETSTRHHQLFQSQIDLPGDLPRFIHQVALGEQKKAEAILKKYELRDKKALNLLLTKKMDVTDIAGKKFKNVTAFQYTLWAMDRHMWEMLLKYLPSNEAKSQLEEWEEKGVVYIKPTLKDKKEESIIEKHFDFSPLIAALADYVDNYLSRNWDQRLAKWCQNVGVAQKDVPAHVIAEYCRLDRSFYPTPTFKETTLPRNFGVFNFLLDGPSYWFSDPTLGSRFAFARGYDISCRAGDRSLVAFGQRTMTQDLWAITALCRVRTDELKMLKDNLLKEAVTSTYRRN